MNNPNVIIHIRIAETFVPCRPRSLTWRREILLFLKSNKLKSWPYLKLAGEEAVQEWIKFALLYNKLLTESLDSSIAALNEKNSSNFHRIFFWERERKTKHQTKRERKWNTFSGVDSLGFFLITKTIGKDQTSAGGQNKQLRLNCWDESIKKCLFRTWFIPVPSI